MWEKTHAPLSRTARVIKSRKMQRILRSAPPRAIAWHRV